MFVAAAGQSGAKVDPAGRVIGLAMGAIRDPTCIHGVPLATGGRLDGKKSQPLGQPAAYLIEFAINLAAQVERVKYLPACLVGCLVGLTTNGLY